MTRKLTVSIDERVYKRLRKCVRGPQISEFVESVIAPHVIQQDLDAEYKKMSQDKQRETEAFEWAEGTLG
ncbi:MAG: hypothetical protein A2268_15240 [Candidatus Raymondbacteria bacterium RifOxyA12_full_50_37]|uniref:Addiction module antitoxin n=1 Tax=Candidatus Raymondbacteria bacterium RIFOXYD12_FULL_49_13 TaxID=1817890 RepID=A0A1F7F6S7_UNCRA|nr:MAG: hypothetical protein A2268_15240 [Candidatus Raymondbacteria bacterium RifOxyA12_full_50_37]OGJ88491.1 MAG: hypothetical protein A2248_20025 [Candidatus Raymondbacteria bacterium RIFOXYA2_FULL_49_16]OGJ90627.1 MAG: hypothetical protein A2350_18490 [Candidatus Raymondbacteria bacterium RifOxyB12_full_50_8]OGJ96197.1 MAG: hypothetical protein A2487_01420 [Candidatus Raymondbacteria bacterium RifOxyC12_full_50_8]OGJ98951.1 MAG: hypothetical protein A2453_10740 [Candidatus Raymondbacteria b